MIVVTRSVDLHLANYARPCSEVDELNIEDESGVGRDDTAGSLSTISEIRRAGESGLLSFGELSDALIPALDHLTGAEDELEGLSARDAGVEDLTVGELASVVNLDFGASRWLASSSFVVLDDFHDLLLIISKNSRLKSKIKPLTRHIFDKIRART